MVTPLSQALSIWILFTLFEPQMWKSTLLVQVRVSPGGWCNPTMAEMQNFGEARNEYKIKNQSAKSQMNLNYSYLFVSSCRKLRTQ